MTRPIHLYRTPVSIEFRLGEELVKHKKYGMILYYTYGYTVRDKVKINLGSIVYGLIKCAVDLQSILFKIPRIDITVIDVTESHIIDETINTIIHESLHATIYRLCKDIIRRPSKRFFDEEELVVEGMTEGTMKNIRMTFRFPYVPPDIPVEKTMEIHYTSVKEHTRNPSRRKKK